jgi:DNA-directed RNA polymerase subunit RPC12/RpoP
MSKQKDPKPLTVRCPNCKQSREPDFNETTKQYVCSICGEPVGAQVFIEKRKRGEK